MSIKEELEALAAAAKRELADVEDAARVEELRVKYLGKKGALGLSMKDMGKLPPEERRSQGEVINQVKGEVEASLTQALTRAEEARLRAELSSPKLDVTLPGRFRVPGRRHVVSRTLEEIVRTFSR